MGMILRSFYLVKCSVKHDLDHELFSKVYKISFSYYVYKSSSR